MVSPLHVMMRCLSIRPHWTVLPQVAGRRLPERFARDCGPTSRVAPDCLYFSSSNPSLDGHRRQCGLPDSPGSGKYAPSLILPLGSGPPSVVIEQAGGRSWRVSGTSSERSSGSCARSMSWCRRAARSLTRQLSPNGPHAPATIRYLPYPQR